MKRFVLRTEADKKAVLSEIIDLATSDPWEVRLVPYKFNRSAEQNRLYWMWMTQCAKEWGGTKEDWHTTFKHKFACHIWIRDDPEYAAAVNELRDGKKKRVPEATKRLLLRLTTTTEFNTAQMKEYMEAVEKEMIENGVLPKIPDEEIGH